MKRLIIYLLASTLLSCNGGRHQPVVTDSKVEHNDSTQQHPYDSLHIPGSDSLR